MSTTDTDLEVIRGLDFPTEIECSGKDCPDRAAHIVRLTPGPEHHSHNKWYPACSTHALHLASGQAKCLVCHQQIALVAIEDL